MADFKSFYGNGGGGAGGQQSLLSNLEVYRINGLYRVIQIIYTYTTQFNRAPTGGAPPEALSLTGKGFKGGAAAVTVMTGPMGVD